MAIIDTAGYAMNTVSAIARRLRREPSYVVQGSAGNRFYAAQWKFPANRIAAECVIDHTLCCVVEGAASISKVADGKSVRKHAGLGAVSFLPGMEPAHYTISEEITLLELYIDPVLLREFSETCSASGRSATVRPFFFAEDPWIKAYFQMLASEVQMYGGGSCELDSLLLSQSQQLLFTHLLRRYSDFGKRDLRELDHRKAGRALPQHLLRRVTEFVQLNLSADVHLADLAALVHLSERHFIRAFHAATGKTPYQYVLDRRLRACTQLLQTDDPSSIADIAKRTGFKSQSHFTSVFKARYKMTPSRYRRTRESR